MLYGIHHCIPCCMYSIKQHCIQFIQLNCNQCSAISADGNIRIRPSSLPCIIIHLPEQVYKSAIRATCKYMYKCITTYHLYQALLYIYVQVLQVEVFAMPHSRSRYPCQHQNIFITNVSFKYPFQDILFKLVIF